jgi:chromosome segregation ATPase
MSQALEPGAENVVLDNLEEIRTELNAIFTSHSQKLLEYKVVISEGITRALEALILQHKRVEDLLQSNAELSRQASLNMESVEKFENLMTELDGQIKDLQDIDAQLGESVENLTEERSGLTSKKKENLSRIEERTEEIQTLNTQLDHLERDNDALKKEKTSLTKEKNRLETEVAGLKASKDEYLTSLARYREIKSGLMV